MTEEVKQKYFDKIKQDKALEWLKLKWPHANQTCEICHFKTWTIAEDLVMPMPFSGNNITFGGSTYPQLMVICSNCGNTKYFNAVIAKLVEPEIKK